MGCQYDLQNICELINIIFFYYILSNKELKIKNVFFVLSECIKFIYQKVYYNFQYLISWSICYSLGENELRFFKIIVNLFFL